MVTSGGPDTVPGNEPLLLFPKKQLRPALLWKVWIPPSSWRTSSRLATEQASTDRAEAAKQAAESARESARMAAAQASADRIEAARQAADSVREDREIMQAT